MANSATGSRASLLLANSVRGPGASSLGGVIAPSLSIFRFFLVGVSPITWSSFFSPSIRALAASTCLAVGGAEDFIQAIDFPGVHISWLDFRELPEAEMVVMPHLARHIL